MTRWSVRLACWLSLGIVFFGSTAIAASYYPKSYDWQHIVLSSLSSPRDNPRAYLVECAGLAISGLLMYPFASWMGERLRKSAPRLVQWAGILFRLGVITLTLSAIAVPGNYRVLGLGRTHEHLAQIMGASLCVALLIYIAAILRMPSSYWRLKAAACATTALPIAAFAGNRLGLLATYVFSTEQNYAALKASYWSSLSLWEWIGAVSIYLFLGLVALGDILEVRRP